MDFGLKHVKIRETYSSSFLLAAMEALRKAHQDEIEKLKRHGGEEPTDPSIRKQLYVYTAHTFLLFHLIDNL